MAHLVDQLWHGQIPQIVAPSNFRSGVGNSVMMMMMMMMMRWWWWWWWWWSWWWWWWWWWWCWWWSWCLDGFLLWRPGVLVSFSRWQSGAWIGLVPRSACSQRTRHLFGGITSFRAHMLPSPERHGHGKAMLWNLPMMDVSRWHLMLVPLVKSSAGSWHFRHTAFALYLLQQPSLLARI